MISKSYLNNKPGEIYIWTKANVESWLLTMVSNPRILAKGYFLPWYQTPGSLLRDVSRGKNVQYTEVSYARFLVHIRNSHLLENNHTWIIGTTGSCFIKVLLKAYLKQFSSDTFTTKLCLKCNDEPGLRIHDKTWAYGKNKTCIVFICTYFMFFS